ncbi:hypothetical protein MHB43_10225 [Paenibacillus sp. FSL H8-0317]|uniref:hypothetical protein n=1 Tax=Paenibacillus sp. FSL H8-0317 TaxID=2921385 RepID=UPI003253502B
MSMQQLKETMELLHKGGAVPLNVVEAVNDLLAQTEEYGTLIEQQGKEMIRLQQLANKQGKELEEAQRVAKIYRKATNDIHNTLRWGDSENALERVETIIELALGQEGEGDQ